MFNLKNMPYKDPKKRKEQWMRWAINHRHDEIRKEKNRSRQFSRYYFKEAKTCSMKGCEAIGERHHYDYSKPLDIIWLCNKHHNILHKPEVKICSIGGCKNIHRAKGLCNTHYEKKRKDNIQLGHN